MKTLHSVRALSGCVAALCILHAGCESSPPQTKNAIPINWGESNSLPLAVAPTDSTMSPWRKVVVLTKGVLTIGLRTGTGHGRVRLTVRSDAGKRTLFQKEVDLSPQAPVNMTIGIDAGTYFIVLEPLQDQVLNAMLTARFQPEDPDALSGSDKEREGAQKLGLAQAKEGAVSFRDGNRTDWFRYDSSAAETLQIRFQPLELAKGVKAECITPTGASFELTGQDKVVIREPGTVWIRVFADQADSGGGYRLNASNSPFLSTEKKGLILKYNKFNATVNLGTEDGIREGLKGFIQRTDGTLVDFVIERALQRSSTAKAPVEFKETDLLLPVHFEHK